MGRIFLMMGDSKAADEDVPVDRFAGEAAFPPRLKPLLWRYPYGGAKAPPLQSRDLVSKGGKSLQLEKVRIVSASNVLRGPSTPRPQRLGRFAQDDVFRVIQKQNTFDTATPILTSGVKGCAG